jgi:hypothetical protein
MKKAVVILVLLVVLTLAFSSVAYAAPGGMPAAHGVEGKEFGGVITWFLGVNGPIALAEHVAGCYAP